MELHYSSTRCINYIVTVPKYLISKGADVNAKTADGFTPLMGAAEMGRADIL